MNWYNHQLALKFRDGKIVNEGTLTLSPTFWTGVPNTAFVDGGKFGDQYLKFSGSAGKRTGYVVDVTGDFTLTMWMKDFLGSNLGASAAYPQPVIVWSNANGVGNGFGIEGTGSTGGIRTVWQVGGKQSNLNLDSSVYADGAWHFIELIRKDTTGYIFIDGKLIESKEFPFKGTMNVVIGSGSNAGNVCGCSVYDLNFYAGVAVFAGIPEKYMNDVCGKEVVLDAFFRTGKIENKAGENAQILASGYDAASPGRFSRNAGHFWTGNYGRIRLPTIGLGDFTIAAFVKVSSSAYVAGTWIAIFGVWNTKSVPGNDIWRSFSLGAFGKDEAHGGKYVNISSNLHDTSCGLYQLTKSECSITDGVWHHVALTRKDGVLSFFVDGQKLGEISTHKGFYVNPAWLDFGAKAGTAAENEIWMDNAVCIAGKAWETFDLVRYLLEPKRLFKKGNSVYSAAAGKWREETNRWAELSGEEKAALFENASAEEPAPEMYEALGTASMLLYSYRNEPMKALLTAVPQDQMVLPKGRIDLIGYEGINRAKVKSVLKNGSCKMLVTTDLSTYQTYDFVESAWKTVDVGDLDAVKSVGIETAKLEQIGRAAWDTLKAEGIGFAYLLSVEHSSDTCAVDELVLQIDMRGRWEKAMHGTDFSYGYLKNDCLEVELKTAGNYKINYSTGKTV